MPLSQPNSVAPAVAEAAKLSVEEQDELIDGLLGSTAEKNLYYDAAWASDAEARLIRLVFHPLTRAEL